MFGIEWVYVDVAGGSMVEPGAPLMKDANELERKNRFGRMLTVGIGKVRLKTNASYINRDQFFSSRYS